MMDPLGAICGTRDCVVIDDLVSWQKTCESLHGVDDATSVDTENTDNLKLEYHFREDINSKIFLWNGDITKVAVQALILPVYEVLSKSSPLSQNLHYSAGPRLIADVRKIIGLRTSEVRVLPGYNLPTRYAIHTVEPRYNPKFYSAADTALHICYRTALQVCAERGLRTVAISPLHITRKGFPLVTGSHIALRTIRKCIEMLGTKFDAVIIVTDPTVVDSYSKLFPTYFPRSVNEAHAELKNVPNNVFCNEWGELFQEERAIRIADISEIEPEENKDILHDSDVDDNIKNNSEIVIDERVTQHSFAQMSGDHDGKRRFMMLYSMQRQTLQSQERIYQRLLRISRNENFSKFSSLGAIKISGRDVNGNIVISIIGKHLNFYEIDLEKFLLYLILTFDPIVNNPYTVVYFHTQTLEFNRPTSEYLKKLYNTFDYRYKSNLSRLCMVHTNTMMKITTWIFASFSVSDLKSRIMNIRSVPELYKIVPPNQIDVPPFVLTYDMKTNPQAYSSSPTRSPTNSLGQRNAKPTRVSDFNQVAHGTL
uniref:ganglioside-induced differentiation-associated-protein 2-like n=1 Tax=Styela clava TaxID=7725 RepID=UPI00193ACC75|nr:ganglioside-induced differentiation-associated-protein 2-like [Styela clava]